jgi:hypothetical protein
VKGDLTVSLGHLASAWATTDEASTSILKGMLGVLELL